MSQGESAVFPIDIHRDPHAEATRLGCYVVEPLDNELQLDIDDESDLAHVVRGLAVLNQQGFAAKMGATTTSKGGNRHVRVVFPRPLSALERVALQACLGSDRVRELLSFVRICRPGSHPPTLFFEPLARVAP